MLAADPVAHASPPPPRACRFAASCASPTPASRPYRARSGRTPPAPATARRSRRRFGGRGRAGRRRARGGCRRTARAGALLEASRGVRHHQVPHAPRRAPRLLRRVELPRVRLAGRGDERRGHRGGRAVRGAAQDAPRRARRRLERLRLHAVRAHGRGRQRPRPGRLPPPPLEAPDVRRRAEDPRARRGAESSRRDAFVVSRRRRVAVRLRVVVVVASLARTFPSGTTGVSPAASAARRGERPRRPPPMRATRPSRSITSP